MFTGLRTARRALKLAQELSLRLEDAEKLLRSVREELQETRASHLKLRGKVYGDRSIAAPGPESVVGESREARRAAAFKKFGLVPGRPVNLDDQKQ